MLYFCGRETFLLTQLSNYCQIHLVSSPASAVFTLSALICFLVVLPIKFLSCGYGDWFLVAESRFNYVVILCDIYVCLPQLGPSQSLSVLSY